MATPTHVPSSSTTRGVSFLPGKLKPRDVEAQIRAARSPEGKVHKQGSRKYGSYGTDNPKAHGQFLDEQERAYRQRDAELRRR